MAKKSVGYVELDVLLNTDELRKRLAGELRDEIIKKVTPAIGKLTDGLKDAQSQIDKINAKPMAEIAKQSGYSTKQNVKLTRSLEDVAAMEKKLLDLEKAKTDATQKYTNARKRLNYWLKKESELGEKMSQDDLDRLEENKAAYIDALKDKKSALTAYDALETRIKRKKEDNDKAELDDIERIRREYRLSHDERLKQLTDEANKLIAESRRKSAALDREEERNEKRDAKRSEREDAARRRGIGGTLKQPFSVVGEIGRTLSGFSLGLSPQAFAVLSLVSSTLVGSLASLSKIMLAMPAAVGALGVALGTIKLGMMGFSDTIGALIDGDLDSFDHLINRLAPNAQQAALAIQKLGPQFSAFQKSVQESLFKDAPQMFTALIGNVLPLLQSTLNGVAQSMNRSIGNMLRQLLTPETMGAFATVMANVVKMFQALEPAAGPFIAAFTNLMATGSTLLPQFGKNLTEVVNKFGDWVKTNTANGKIVEWIKEGISTLGKLAKLAWHFGEALVAIAPAAEAALPYLIGALETVSVVLKEFPWLILAVPGALLAWKSIAGIVSLTRDLGVIIKMMGGMGGVASKASNAMGFFFGKLTGKGGALAVALAAVAGIVDGMNRIDGKGGEGNDAVGILETTGGWALAGAAAGSVVPVVGTGTGALVGGAAGLIAGLTQYGIQNSKETPEEAAARIAAADAARGPQDPTVFGPLQGLGPNPIGSAPVVPPVEIPKPKSLTDLLVPPGIDNPLPVTVTELPAPPPGTPLPSPLDPVTSGSPDDPMAEANRILAEAGLSPITLAPGAGQDWGPWNNLPVPPDTKDARGNAIPDPKEQSDSDRMKEVLAGLDPSQFAVDPFGPINGVQNQPGWPNQSPLNVALPDGIPGLSNTLPGMAMMPGGISGNIVLPSSLPAGGSQGTTPEIGYVEKLAAQFGLTLGSGKRDWAGTASGTSYHLSGQAGDFSNGQSPTPQMRAFAEAVRASMGSAISELIYSDDSGWSGNLLDGKPHQYSQQTLDEHRNHVHVAIKQGALNGAVTGMPSSLRDNLYAQNGPLISDPLTGDQGYMQVDQQRVAQLAQSLKETARDLTQLNMELRATEILVGEGRKTEMDVQELRDKINDKEFDLRDKQLSLQEAMSGKFKQAPNLNLDDLPFGDPRKVLGAAIQGAGGSSSDVTALLGGVFGNAVGAAAGAGFPGIGTPTAPQTDLSQLVREGNPMAFAQGIGLNVPDYTRAGGGASAQNLTLSGGPSTDPMGRMYSDTASLIDRTFTNLDAANKARHDQMMAVMNQVAERLGVDLLGPALAEGVSSGLEGLNATATADLGRAIGQAAAGPIADAVRSVMGSGGSSGTGSTAVDSAVSGVTALFGLGRADGGPIVGPGTGTSDSILARLSNGEYVLTAEDVQRMGGFSGVDRFRSALSKSKMPKFAVGGGVIADKTVGADFFGVSEVPLVGAIVNLLVTVLLKVINVQIEARDTLNEISSEVRQFRGDVQAFDAAGRLMSDTSGLVDRSGSSEQAAADERIRILKLVIEGIFKFLIEKILVPIGKAIANSVLQAGAGAASGAIGASFPGGSIVGGMVGDIISSSGSAAIDIGGEIATIAGNSLVEVLTAAVGDLIRGIFPNASTAVFGGGLLAALFNPVTEVLNNITGAGNMLVAGIGAALAGVFGALSTLIPGIPFDEGGVAVGTGLMPKATIAPERVLSPRQTALFEKMVSALESGNSSSASTTTIHAPFTVTGSERGGRVARDRLLALMS